MKKLTEETKEKAIRLIGLGKSLFAMDLIRFKLDISTKEATEIVKKIKKEMSNIDDGGKCG